LNRVESLRLGSLPVGSVASRAAARALLRLRDRAASTVADVRIVIDLGVEQSAGAVSRGEDAHGNVVEFIFPAQGECLGVFEVPRGETVEDALRRAKGRRLNSGFVIDLERNSERIFARKLPSPKALGG
jgi:hypothetical protein